ncbi:hypothetical protein ABW21_db0202068 [Orbilia brochopaga]|nr:hypothetical protein ABW21_db0202068 [Drechslerella brochopaga]
MNSQTSRLSQTLSPEPSDQDIGTSTIMGYSGQSRKGDPYPTDSLPGLPFPTRKPSRKRGKGAHRWAGDGTAPQWSGQVQPAFVAEGKPAYFSSTDYIVRHACELAADYEDVHELYARRYGGDPHDDEAVRKAIFADIAGVMAETSGGKARDKRYLEQLKQDGIAYSSTERPQIGRTTRQHQRHLALLARDDRISRAERATEVDIGCTHDSLAALKRRGGAYRTDPHKHRLLAECYADQSRLYHRLDELHTATKEILEKRMREKAAAQKMREQGWQGAFLVDEGDSADEGTGMGVGGLMPWGVDDEIGNALKGTGAIVLGFADSEDDDEGLFDTGFW